MHIQVACLFAYFEVWVPNWLSFVLLKDQNYECGWNFTDNFANLRIIILIP